MKVTNPTTAASRRYVLEFSAALVLYVVVLLGTRMFFREYHGPFLPAIALAPMVPLLLVFLAALRLFRGTDEFSKRMMTDSLAIAGTITALIAATYGFLQGETFPNPSAWWTWTVFMVSWLVATLVLKLRYR